MYICSLCGNKMRYGMPFFGRDGKVYCEDHILPENREKFKREMEKNLIKDRKPKKTKPKSNKKTRRSK